MDTTRHKPPSGSPSPSRARSSRSRSRSLSPSRARPRRSRSRSRSRDRFDVPRSKSLRNALVEEMTKNIVDNVNARLRDCRLRNVPFRVGDLKGLMRVEHEHVHEGGYDPRLCNYTMRRTNTFLKITWRDARILPWLPLIPETTLRLSDEYRSGVKEWVARMHT